MHEIRTDMEKNRLYVTIGKVDGPSEMDAIAAEIETALGDLKPGFTCLTDLREYEVGEEKDEIYILKTQKMMVDAGLSNVVRVVKKFGVLGHFQFDKSSVEVGYHAQNVNTVAEAEKILDSGKE